MLKSVLNFGIGNNAINNNNNNNINNINANNLLMGSNILESENNIFDVPRHATLYD